MSSPKIKVVEAPAPTESPSQAATQGTYKVFNRIVDWITNDRMQLLNITDRVNELVRKSGVKDGIIHLQSLHTTTAVFINEWQDALVHDVKDVSRSGGRPRAVLPPQRSGILGLRT